jgi:phosphoribosylformimino-5-aminoimidazole carboxamide ribotide isomerase
MIVYPAMDLMGGRCVRLAQGRFDDVARYAADPFQALLGFKKAGAEWAHVVDLDGAREGAPRQHELLAEIAASAPTKLQVAGGFREIGQLWRMFDAGVARIAIGSLAVKAPKTVQGFLAEFGGDRIVLALDVNVIDGEPIVATVGWAETSGASLWDIAGLYLQAKHILITDIGRDGMMTGPNITLIAEATRRLPHLSIQASGGVASLDDLRALMGAGASGAIVGKALWEGRVDLTEAIDVAHA